MPPSDGDPLTAGAVVNDGRRVIAPAAYVTAEGWVYLAKDCDLSAPAGGWSFTSVTDGGRITLEPVYAVKPSVCQQVAGRQAVLMHVRPVRVQATYYPDALIVWWLDLDRAFRAVDLKGKLGIQPPTSAETGGYAVTALQVFGKETGVVAGGDIDATSGALDELWELKTVDCTLPHPVLFDGGVVNAASFAAGQPVAPGSLVSIHGFDLARSLTLAASVPLPAQIEDVSVAFNGIPAPLIATVPKASATVTQINAQVPWNVLSPGVASGSATVVVQRGSVTSPALQVQIVASCPGVFAYPPGAGRAVAVLRTDDHRNGALAAPVDSIPGLKTFPARAGDTLEVYATGLGAVDIPIANGHSSADQVRRTGRPTVSIGDVPAEVLFSGLSPSFAGVNQLNVRLPLNSPTGYAVPLQIQIGACKTTDKITIAIE
jgi:uncharacterized protein (TIGR03437 family)